MYPKEFIKVTFLQQYKKICYEYHYIAFTLIPMGIEFLGKCLDEKSDWQTRDKSNIHFDLALKELMPNYVDLNLYSSLRCGMVHALLPKFKVGLTNRKEAIKYSNKNLQIKENQLILVAEDFYDDFNNACEKVLKREFNKNSKMNKPFLHIPN